MRATEDAILEQDVAALGEAPYDQEAMGLQVRYG
jgi:hypothetical protein